MRRTGLGPEPDPEGADDVIILAVLEAGSAIKGPKNIGMYMINKKSYSGILHSYVHISIKFHFKISYAHVHMYF